MLYGWSELDTTAGLLMCLLTAASFPSTACPHIARAADTCDGAYWLYSFYFLCRIATLPRVLSVWDNVLVILQGKRSCKLLGPPDDIFDPVQVPQMPATHPALLKLYMLASRNFQGFPKLTSCTMHAYTLQDVNIG